MPTLDERLRAAKPQAPPLPEDFAARVMEGMRARGIAIRPAPRPWRLGWLAGAAAAALAGAVLVNAALFELRNNGALELLAFGGRFVDGVAARLPYDFLLAALMLAGLAGLLLRKGLILRTRVAWLLLLSYGATSLAGLALASSGVNEELQAKVEADRIAWPGMHWFFRERARFMPPPPHFRFGVVMAVSNGRVQLLSPLGDEITVNLPPGFRAQVGDHLRLTGAASDGRFEADQAQICQPGWGRRYFRGGMGPGMRGMGPGMMHGGAPDAGFGPDMPRPPGMGPPGRKGPRVPMAPGMPGPMGPRPWGERPLEPPGMPGERPLGPPGAFGR
jgi:hypothetical protein